MSCVLTGQYDRSIQICQRQIQISSELCDVRAEAYCYGVLGDAHSGQGRWELAIESLQRPGSPRKPVDPPRHPGDPPRGRPGPHSRQKPHANLGRS